MLVFNVDARDARNAGKAQAENESRARGRRYGGFVEMRRVSVSVYVEVY